MIKCEGCGKEYKTQRGLAKHLSEKCEAIANVFAIPAKVERKASKRGRPVKQMPGLDALIANWDSLEIGEAYPIPGHDGDDSHPAVTLTRYHVKRRAIPAGYRPGIDYTVESHPEVGAVIIRKA